MSTTAITAARLDELRSLIAAHARPDGGSAVGGLLLSRVESAEPHHSLTEPLLVVMAQGGKRLLLGDEVFEYRAGQCLIVTADLPVTGHFLGAGPDHPSLALGLVLRPGAIAPLLLESTAPRPTRRTAIPPSIATGDAGPELLDGATRLVRLLDHPADAPVLAPLIEREILWRLLCGPHGAMIRQIGLPDSNLTHINRAVQWIRDNYAEPLRVDDLAGLAGMSTSAFHRHFRTITATSPLQFQKRIRLQEARTLLLASPTTSRVPDTSSVMTASRSSPASTVACSTPRRAATPHACTPRLPLPPPPPARAGVCRRPCLTHPAWRAACRRTAPCVRRGPGQWNPECTFVRSKCRLLLMTVAVMRPPVPAERRARAAVAVLFFTNGALFANLLPRFPQIKADLGIGNAAYGLAVAAFPTGAIAAGLAAGVLIRRLGSGRVAVAGTLLTGIGVLAAGLANSVVLFGTALFLAGAMDAITDVAQNAHGLRVQRRYGRSIINSFHAIWSIGAVTGGSMAAGAIALGLPRGQHLLISAVVFGIAACAALRFCLTGPDTEPTPDENTAYDLTAAEPTAYEVKAAEDGAREPQGRRTGRTKAPPRTGYVLAALVLIAAAGALVEDAGSSWAALYLSDSLHASGTLAASGYIALVGAQFVGRLIGDRLVDRFGQRTVARFGGLIAAVGMSLALAVPTATGTILGFATAGFGVATLVPAAMHEADELPGLKPGSGLTIVSWLMRLGFLLSPPIVGLVADATSLRVGLLVVPLAGALVMVLAGVLRPRRR